MLFNNTNIVRDDLRKEIMAASIMLMYHQELKQLEFIEYRFIYIAPTFVKEKPRNKSRVHPTDIA